VLFKLRLVWVGDNFLDIEYKNWMLIEAFMLKLMLDAGLMLNGYEQF